MEKELGAEGALKVEMKDGKVLLTLSYDGKGVDGVFTATADTEYFIDKVFEFVPGDSALEQMAKAVIKQSIKGMKV